MKINTLQHVSLAVITLVLGITASPALASPVLPNNQVPAIGDANALTESPTFELEDKRLSDMLILSMQAKYPELARQPGLSITLNRDQVDTESTNAKADSVTVEDLQVDAGRRSYRATMQVWSASQPIGLLAVSGQLRQDASPSATRAASKTPLTSPSLNNPVLAEAKDATKVMADIPVLTRNIRSGEIISADDLAMQSIKRARL
jgi:hypothetical protein